jgi:hypothetical protein
LGDPIPDLKNVKVYVLGLDGAGRPITYWKNPRAFWIAYSQAAGAMVMNYSVLQEGPNFEVTRAFRSANESLNIEGCPVKECNPAA